MCTLTVCAGVFDSFPLVVGANRDEFYGRPSAIPMLVHSAPRVFAPLDLKAGGTWLGINEYGLFAGLTNLSGVAEIDRSRPSRGAVLLESLRAKTAAEAAEAAAVIASKAACNPFQAIFCGEGTVRYLRYDGAIRVEELGGGVWSLSNWDAERELKDHKSGIARRFLQSIPPGSDASGIIAGVSRMLSDHTGDGWREHICVHTEVYGTMSSSIVLLGRARAESAYIFYDGHPCETGAADLSAKMTGALGW